MVLWRERELLDTLLFRLELEQLVLASGRTRWLMRAAGDVEQVLGRLRETELLRAVAADEAAAAIGLEPNPSLRELAEKAPEPWREIFVDHREAVLAVTREITALADANRDLITAGYRSARETLLTIGTSVGTTGVQDGYTADGTASLDSARARLLDRSL